MGGPRDGEKKDVGLEDKTIFTFQAPEAVFVRYTSKHPSPDLKPYIARYERVAVTPGGVAVFEVQPRRTTTVIEIEVVHHDLTEPKLVRELAAAHVTRISDDYRALTAGITAARLKD